MQYTEYRKLARTGDVILFSGKGGVSTAIKWITSSKWSHVGLVVVSQDQDTVLLWESTTLSNVKDIEFGRFQTGVQTVPLSERMRVYDGDVNVRRMIVPLQPYQEREIYALRRELSGRPYEKSLCELIRSAYDGPFGRNEPDLSSLFCSELVAEAFKRTGQDKSDVPSNERTPADFAKSIKGGYCDFLYDAEPLNA